MRTIRKLGDSAQALALGLAMATLTMFLGSCYWNPQNAGVGKATLNLQSFSRGQINASLTYARVYLYADNMNSVVNLGDETPYVQVPISNNSVTVNNIPAGTSYQLVVTFGTLQNGAYVPQQYAWTQNSTFDVTANHQTVVSLTGNVNNALQPLSTLGISGSSEVPMMLGQNIVDAVTDGSVIAAATSTAAHFTNVSSANFGDITPGSTINSVTFADMNAFGGNNSEFWLNTSSGIKEYYMSPTSGLATPAQNLPTGLSKDVLHSIVYGNTVYYVSDQELGGIQLTANNPAWQKITLSSNSSNPDIVLDMSVYSPTSTSGVFTTQIGAFLVDTGFAASGDQGLAYLTGPNTTATFWGITSGGTKRFVTTLDDASDFFFVGTNDGLFQSDVTGVQQTPLPMGPTAGHLIKKILTLPTGYLVAVSNNLICIQDSQGVGWVTIPATAWTLGTLHSIAFDPVNGAFLLLSGSEGLMVIQL